MCIASAESLAAIKFRVPARFRNRGPRERRVIPLRAAAAQAPATMKLRVLALHSFRTSGSIFRDQLEALGNWPNAIGDLCEFVYVDAPHPASGEVPEIGALRGGCWVVRSGSALSVEGSPEYW